MVFSLKTVEWRQNLNRDYKKISPQKMSPSHSSETQTVIGLFPSLLISALIVNILQFVFSGKQAVNKCFKLAIKQPVLDILRGLEISIKHKKRKR